MTKKLFQTMFLSEFIHTIDDKGRVTIPARYRSFLEEGMVLTRGFEQNLMIFTLDGWQELADKIVQRPISDGEVRAFRRRFFSGAVDVVLDKQGRIVIPAYLREFADIDGEVVISGMYNYVEIWAGNKYQEVREGVARSDDAQRWADLGF